MFAAGAAAFFGVENYSVVSGLAAAGGVVFEVGFYRVLAELVDYVLAVAVETFTRLGFCYQGLRGGPVFYVDAELVACDWVGVDLGLFDDAHAFCFLY